VRNSDMRVLLNCLGVNCVKRFNWLDYTGINSDKCEWIT
jgi:hypothetical protein